MEAELHPGPLSLMASSDPLPFSITSVPPTDPERLVCTPPPPFHNGCVLSLLGNRCLKTQWLDFAVIFF